MCRDPPPAPPQGTDFTGCASTKAGETCNGTCTDGYVPSFGPASATCGANGEWDTDSIIYCENPSIIGECHSGSNACLNTPVLSKCHTCLALHSILPLKDITDGGLCCAAVCHDLQVALAIPLHLKGLCSKIAPTNMLRHVQGGLSPPLNKEAANSGVLR